MNILYITMGETPRFKGVYGSQVLNQIKEINHLSNKYNMILVAGVPIIHSGLFREKLNYYNELKTIRTHLNKIPFHFTLIPIIQTFFYSKKFEFNIFHMFAYKRLKKYINLYNPKILHCRSYHAAYAAIKAKERYQYEYKIIFDPRGLWPEEAIQKKKITEGGNNYRFLKEIEKEILEKVDIVVSVSDTMKEHYERIVSNHSKQAVIYLSAPVEAMAKQSLNYQNQTITLCYLGALSNNVWHKPKLLLEVYREFRKHIKDTKLLIITRSNYAEILACLGDIPRNEIELVTTKTSKELSYELQKASFGVLPYLLPSTVSEKFIAETMIGSKTAEYLAMGLPILVNKYCGGAAKIVEKLNVGIIYDPASLNTDFSENKIRSYYNVDISKKAKKFAFENFDYKICAKRYIDIYQSLIS